MKRTVNARLFFVFLLGIFAASCESGPDYNELYRMEKQYWEPDDYLNAIYKISATAPGSKKPCYSVPETAPVFAKLVNIQNVAVIVEDEALGVAHRSAFAEKMFDHSRDMVQEYSVMNREDKYEYPQEFIDVLRFHFYTQMHYFDLGNQNILKQADDPKDAEGTIKNNEQILVNNFAMYLDFAGNEDAFTPDALQSYIDLLNEYFPPVIAKYPNANYGGMKEKATNMLNKTKSDSMKAALTDLIAKIDANTAKVEADKAAAAAAADSAAVAP